MNVEARREEAAPSNGRAVLFVVLLAVYYAAYYWVFAHRLAEYARDLQRHFSFLSRVF